MYWYLTHRGAALPGRWCPGGRRTLLLLPDLDEIPQIRVIVSLRNPGAAGAAGGGGCLRLGTLGSLISARGRILAAAATAIMGGRRRSTVRERIGRIGRPARLAHDRSALDAADVHRLKLVGIRVGLDQRKIHIFALHQVLVLRIGNANGRIMNENVLAFILAVFADGDESKPRLVVEPLDGARQALNNHNVICGNGGIHGIGMMDRIFVGRNNRGFIFVGHDN